MTLWIRLLGFWRVDRERWECSVERCDSKEIYLFFSIIFGY